MQTATFNSADPAVEHISPPGVEPEAIYVWLIYTPGVLGRSLAAVAIALRGLTKGCPLFTRAVTKHTEKLFPAMGFEPAPRYFPNCRPDLLVAHPRALAPAAEIKVRFARTMEDIAKVFSVRAATYMAEQECPYDEEFDGNDFCATHLLAERNGEPVGCVRLRYFANWAKIERLAVRKEFRGAKGAETLVRHALEHLRDKGYGSIYAHARHDLLGFWARFGFEPIDDRPTFSFSNVLYREIVLSIDPAPVVSIGTHPLITIRPEGAWKEAGPLDRSAKGALQ